MQNKYHNKKTIIDNITFDSKREAQRYCELKLLQRAGEISHLELQPEFVLLETFKKNGKTHRGIKYIADFMYCDTAKGGAVVVEDVKGVETKEFKIKRKLFESKYPDLSLTIL